MISCIIILTVLICFPVMSARADDGESVAILYGRLTNQDFIEIPFNFQTMEPVHMLGVSLRKELMELSGTKSLIPSDLYLDGEVVVAEKWGRLKGVSQDFQEIAVSLNIRYEFPDYFLVVKSFSLGNGLSLTSEKSKFEETLTIRDKTSCFLWYMLLELELDISGHQNWGVLCRVHHRSGIFGVFNDVNGGSNYITMGLRYHF